MPFVRSNYKIREPYEIPPLPSFLFLEQTVYALQSDTGDVLTFSCGGYGIPEWMRVRMLSGVGGTIIDVMGYCVDQSTSLVYVSLYGFPITYTNVGSYSLGSLGATVNAMFEVIALIASR